jgi:cell division protease FtsH
MAENKDNSGLNPKIKKPKFSFYWIYAILAVVFIAIQYFNYTNPVKEITWGKLEEMLIRQDVEKIVIINKEKAEVFIKQEKLKTDTAYKEFTKRSFGNSKSENPEFFYQIGSEEIFHGLLKDTRDSVISRMKKDSLPAALIADFQKQYPYPPSTDTRKDVFGDIFSYLLPILILVGAWFLIMRFMS